MGFRGWTCSFSNNTKWNLLPLLQKSLGLPLQPPDVFLAAVVGVGGGIVRVITTVLAVVINEAVVIIQVFITIFCCSLRSGSCVVRCNRTERNVKSDFGKSENLISNTLKWCCTQICMLLVFVYIVHHFQIKGLIFLKAQKRFSVDNLVFLMFRSVDTVSTFMWHLKKPKLFPPSDYYWTTGVHVSVLVWYSCSPSKTYR